MKAFIYGAGNGLRVYPFSIQNAKMLLPIFGVPVVKIQLKMLETFGITDIDLIFSKDNEGQLDNICNEFPNLQIQLLKVQADHAQAWRAISNNYHNHNDVLVINSDIIFSLSWLKNLNNIYNSADTLFFVCDNAIIDDGQEGQKIWYTLTSEGKIKDYSLSSIDNYLTANEIGISKLPCDFFDKISLSDERQNVDYWYDYFVPLLFKTSNVAFYLSRDFWKDIGTWRRYQKIHLDILDYKAEGLEYLLDDFLVFDKRNCVHISSSHNAEVQYGQNSVIFKNVKIGKRTVITESIIGENVTIGDDCRVKDCIVLENSILNSRTSVCHKIIDGDKQYDRKD